MSRPLFALLEPSREPSRPKKNLGAEPRAEPDKKNLTKKIFGAEPRAEENLGQLGSARLHLDLNGL
jgi:hypothetical protein